MGIEVVVHGFIECSFGEPRANKLIYQHNVGVIRALPKNDNEWPFIDRSLFNVHPPKAVVPYYRSNLITFGGVYKNMYRFESDWLLKFERILSQLCWSRASIFLQFCNLRCDWIAEDAHALAFADPPQPPVKWSMRFMRLTEEELTFSQAVDEIQSNLARDRPRE